MPVLHGDCFRTFLDEARSIGNEVASRRVYDADVAAYLTEKGLVEEFSAWLTIRGAPKT